MNNDDERTQAKRGVERITAIWRFMRSPALTNGAIFNVLFGKMNVIGSRHHVK